MSRILLILFIFCLSWTDILKVNQWLPITQFFVFGLLIASFFDKKFKLIWNKEDIFLLISLFILTITGLININSKSFNYLLAYYYVFLIIYIFIKSFFCSYYFKFETFMNTNMYSILFICIYSVIEFVFETFFGIDTSQFLFKTKEASALYDFGLSRSYGFSTEPTTLALYMNIMGPLAVHQIKKNYNNATLKILLISMIILGWFFTFSAAAILFLSVSIILTALIYFYKSTKTNLGVKHLLISIFLLLIIVVYYDSLDFSFFEKIFNKVTLTQGGTSVDQRTGVFSISIQRILENPIIGYGIGYTSSMNEMSAINWYLELLINGGIISTIPIFIFLILKYLKVLKLVNFMPPYFHVSFICAILGFVATSTFYNPFFWTLLAFIEMKYLILLNEKNSRSF